MTDDQERLLPCPFCGSNAAFRWCGGIVLAECTSCGVSKGDTAGEVADQDQLRKSAAEHWNRRATQPALGQQGPEGFVLVPKMPTIEMINAAVQHMQSAPWADYPSPVGVWMTMLAAAPNQIPKSDGSRNLSVTAADDLEHSLARPRSGVADTVALNPASSPASNAEVVAWRWRFKPAHIWNYAESEDDCKWHGDVEYEPLFASRQQAEK